MTQAKYAEHRKKMKLDGVSRQAVNKKVKAGAIPVTMIEGVAYIDPKAADAAWAANSARPPVTKAGPETGREVRNDGQARELTTLAKVRIKSEGLTALKKQIEVNLLEGTVLPRDEVKRELFEAMNITRDQLRGMPAKLGLPLAQTQTPQEVSAILNPAIREILSELERKFREILDAGRSTSQGNQPASGYNGQRVGGRA